MVSSMCGDTLVRSTTKIVPCLQSSMVVVASWSGLHDYCWYWGAVVHWGKHGFQHVLWHSEAEDDALPSETVFQHNNHPQTHHQDDNCLADEAEGEGDGVAKYVSRLNPIEHMWGILKRKVEKHHVSNIQQLCGCHYGGVEEDACNNLCSSGDSMPRRIKAVLDNNGAPTKILILWTQFWHVHLGCTHFCCHLFGQ